MRDLHEIPPLASWAREALDQERPLPSVPANRRDRAVARARSAARAGEAPAPLRLSAGVSRMRWAIAATLVCAAAAAGATALEWRGRAASRVPGPVPVASPDSGGARAVIPAAKIPEGDPSSEVRERPSDPATTRAAEPPGPVNRVVARAGLSDELRVLAPARAAVARGDFGAALTAIAEHARRFREGRLVEEREALRVKALAGLGNVKEARAASAEFRRRFPRSALLPALAGSLERE